MKRSKQLNKLMNDYWAVQDAGEAPNSRILAAQRLFDKKNDPVRGVKAAEKLLKDLDYWEKEIEAYQGEISKVISAI